MTNIIKDYYNHHAEQEWERLQTPLSAIEFASALGLIKKYFPAHGKVCDIGGGPGRYALELAKQGYTVTLLDLSDELIALAKSKFKELGLEADGFIVDDARNLSQFASNSYDAALLMGPMYHLIDPIDRANVLKELKRILKPGGIALVTYINTWGLMRTGLADFPDWYKEIDLVRSLLGDKVFKGAALSGFTEAYWSTPEIALQEIKNSGLEIVSRAGAEGFAGGMQPLLEHLAAESPDAYTNIIQLAAETCELPQYRDATEHLHIVARKPNE
jgi:ubiquinone/menaquinone biosynthesis C-methylase UbiE